MRIMSIISEHIELYRSYKDKLSAYGKTSVKEIQTVSPEEIKKILMRIHDAMEDVMELTMDIIKAIDDGF